MAEGIECPEHLIKHPPTMSCPLCVTDARDRAESPKASEVQVAGAHYKDFVIQPSEFIHRNGIGFMEGNVIKYVCRHKRKNGRQDIEKAVHYLQLLLEWEYPVEPARIEPETAPDSPLSD